MTLVDARPRAPGPGPGTRDTLMSAHEGPARFQTALAGDEASVMGTGKHPHRQTDRILRWFRDSGRCRVPLGALVTVAPVAPVLVVPSSERAGLGKGTRFVPDAAVPNPLNDICRPARVDVPHIHRAATGANSVTPVVVPIENGAIGSVVIVVA